MYRTKHCLLLSFLWACLMRSVYCSWHFVTYADKGAYLATAKLYNSSYVAAGFKTFTHWTRETFRESKWYTEYKVLFEHAGKIGHEKARDRSHWLWKPMIILDALERLPENEWIFYSDSSSYHSYPISDKFQTVMPMLEKLAFENSNHQCECIPVTRLTVSIGWEFAMRIHLGANFSTALSIVSPNIPQQTLSSWSMGQASWSLWRNTYRSRRFVREWIDTMRNEELLSVVPFADQTICELLVVKHNMKAFWWPHDRFIVQKQSGNYDGAGNPVKSILYENAIQSYAHTASMRYLHHAHPLDAASKKVAVCVTGLPGSSDKRIPESWKEKVLNVLDADLFVVSPAWPQDHWPLAKGVMNDDINVIQFYDEHVPNWNLTKRGNNYLNGLPGFDPGSGASQVAAHYLCSKLINDTERERGFPYEYIGTGRADLFWPNAHPSIEWLSINQTETGASLKDCWIPCLTNDWGGMCDHYALCRRHAAAAILTGLLDVLPVLDIALNSERLYLRSLQLFHVDVIRSEVHFIRSCEDPKISGFENPKCTYFSKIGLYGKKSGGQGAIYAV